MASAAKRQDLPPPGGYNPISYKRVPAKTFFNGMYVTKSNYIITLNLKIENYRMDLDRGLFGNDSRSSIFILFKLCR